MKRVIIVFIAVTVFQLVVCFWKILPLSSSSFPGKVIWWALLPGVLPFLFLPISFEIVVRHPWLYLFPILVNSYLYSMLFAISWLVTTKLRRGRAN